MMEEISPLFAVEAEQLLLSGFPEEAIELCKEGLEVYPDYPSALAILAKANELAGFTEEAEFILNSAKDSYYCKSLENISYINIDQEVNPKSLNDFSSENNYEDDIKENPLDFEDLTSEIEVNDFKFEDIEESLENVTKSKTFEYIDYESNESLIDYDNNTQQVIPEEILIIPDLKTEILLQENNNFETETKVNLENIKSEKQIPFAKSLKKSMKIDEISVKSKNLNINDLISSHINIRLKNSTITESLFKPVKAKVMITETMADILSKQGSTQQAIDIYSKLALIEPEKTNYFNQKIEQIRNNY